jgi:hypothetical protein
MGFFGPIEVSCMNGSSHQPKQVIMATVIGRVMMEMRGAQPGAQHMVGVEGPWPTEGRQWKGKPFTINQHPP